MSVLCVDGAPSGIREERHRETKTILTFKRNMEDLTGRSFWPQYFCLSSRHKDLIVLFMDTDFLSSPFITFFFQVFLKLKLMRNTVCLLCMHNILMQNVLVLVYFLLLEVISLPLFPYRIFYSARRKFPKTFAGFSTVSRFLFLWTLSATLPDQMISRTLSRCCERLRKPLMSTKTTWVEGSQRHSINTVILILLPPVAQG